MKKHNYLLVICVGAICLSGCAIAKNITEGVVGDYIGNLERSRANGKSQTFDYKIDECFNRVSSILNYEKSNAEILKIDINNKSILAVVSRATLHGEDNSDNVFDMNTADVGIFFTKEGESKTKVEVCSLSSLFVDHTAEIIFSKL